MAYSPAVLDHFHRPRNAGAIENPDATGVSGSPGHGNFMVMYLRVSDGRLVDARFQTYGCPGAIACGSMVTELAKGRTLAEAHSISDDDVVRALGGLPPGKGHCAGLAVDALRDAVEKAEPPPVEKVT